jgi:hypothetical protein
MTADEYNQRELDSERLTLQHIRILTQFWQEHHPGLSVDGECGPMTRASLVAADTGSSLGSRALDVAIGFLGAGEEGGNNSGAFVESLHRKEFDGDDDDDGAWCAAFVSTCFEQACIELGLTMPFRRSGGAKSLYRRVGKAGSFVTAPDILPGDVVAWDRGDVGSWQGHVGIVERYDSATGFLHTIEGNVGRYPSKVRRFVHDMSKQPRLEGISRSPEGA